jgi:hypothetical protein
MEEKLTACCGGDAGAGHDDDAAGLAGLDEVGDGSEAALLQGERRGVIVDVRLFLAHLAPVPFSFSLALWFLRFRLCLLSLNAKVVVELVKIVEVVPQLGLMWARPSSTAAAYLGGVAAVPMMVRGTVWHSFGSVQMKFRLRGEGASVGA